MKFIQLRKDRWHALSGEDGPPVSINAEPYLVPEPQPPAAAPPPSSLPVEQAAAAGGDPAMPSELPPDPGPPPQVPPELDPAAA